MNKKILWISEYCVGTGFSRVSESLIKFLAPHYDITVLDLYRTIQGRGIYKTSYSPTEETTVNIIGKGQSSNWSADIVLEEMEKYDYIFMLQDIWNINELLKEIRKSGRRYPKIVIYTPVDALNHNPEWYKNADMIYRLVTFTKYAKDEILRCINSVFSDVDSTWLDELVSIIPHGIDMEVFYEITDKTRTELREELYGTPKFNDCFIFLNANRNQPRKRLNLTLEAFSIFLGEITARSAEPANAMLHMHCGNTDDNHIDVINLGTRLGIEKNLIVSQGAHGSPRWSEKKLNLLYNATDAGLNTGIGEGWGLCNTEHAGIGKPQIVPAHSACLELFGDGSGIVVRAETSSFQDRIMTTGKIVDTTMFAEEMIDLYNDKDGYNRISLLSKNKFSSDTYRWSEISKMWIKIFADE